MKTTNSSGTGGVLLGAVGGPYYATWAAYLLRFLDAYHTHGIDFWGVGRASYGAALKHGR